jgi:thioesterase domain-containing protein
MQLPSIREAAVLATDDGLGDRLLVAYFVEKQIAASLTSESSSPGTTTAELRTHLAAFLPPHMVPAAYVKLESLPLTPNGKLDRKLLAAIGDTSYAQAEYEAPEGELEHAIVEVWAGLLPQRRIGRHDDFFALGGHSLMVLRAVNQLKKAGIAISVAEMFKYATVESLAAHVARNAERDSDRAAILIREGTRPALFLVHDGSGSMIYAHVLAQHVTLDCAIYGLAAVPLGETQLCTMEAMATRMVAMIRSVQSTGPYRIAGWSFGGMLAYEIARQLLKEDEQTVEYVGLMDTVYAYQTEEHLRVSRDEKDHLLAMMQIEALGNEELEQAFAHLKVESDSMDFAALMQRCLSLKRELIPAHLADLPETEVEMFLHRQIALHSAMAEYRAEPIYIVTHLFVAKETDLGERFARFRGWDQVLPEARIKAVSVPGNHYSMMKSPHVKNLCGALDHSM